MMAFSLWKQLKRRLRRNRKPLWTLGGIALWLFGCLFATGATAHAEPNASSAISRYLESTNETVPVLLRRVYICGEETEALGPLKPDQVISLLREHSEWSSALDQDERTVMLTERIEDLSDHCKTHAYFGVDRKGNFTLFDGIPKEEKVMRTFFQLDIRYMESSLPKQQLDELNAGIRVSDMDEYNSVLSTYSDYAMERDEKAMNQAY
ncbi:BofC C-terminal domain-containing protein [Paenibacillus sp. PL2-23]|uniref:BofC C-terminal domain-containing protein n=1 Tax=Paenibacillus sp. PL2-23 TaxID=2100729 RepID=UPI0030FD1678